MSSATTTGTGVGAEERQRIVDRIRKILDKTGADSGAMQGEIEAALEMARKLMDKFNLSHADLVGSESRQKTAFESMVNLEAYSRAYRIDTFDMQLAHVCDNVCDTKHYRSTHHYDIAGKALRSSNGRVRPVDALFFYGLPLDVELSVQLYHELLSIMRATERFSLGKKPSWTEHADYCQGFVDKLYAKSRELKKASDVAAEMGAIVLVKTGLLKRKAQEIGLVPASKRTGQRVSRDASSAYAAGQEDADRVSLGRRERLSGGTSSSRGALE